MSEQGSEAQTAHDQQPEKYSNDFWSKNPKVTALRKQYLKSMAGACMLTIIFAWMCLPFYWGSLWKTSQHMFELSAWVVNLDSSNSVAFAALENAVRTAVAEPTPHMGWQIQDASRFTGAEFGGNVTEELINRLLEEETWLIVIVNPGADDVLLTARQTGNATYTGTSAVSALYMGGRNENAYRQAIFPQIVSVIQPALQKASANSTASYLNQNSGNATAITLLTQAQGTIATPYSLSRYDLRPFSATVATAVDLVGLIYLMILAFIQTMAGASGYGPLAPYLKYRSLVMMRIFTPLVSYIFVAFFYTMIDLPFKLPFGAKYTYAGGFFLWYVFVYMGMAALGLATEAVVTLVGPQFMAFFLIAWIIINVSEVSVPIPMTGNVIYRIGYAFPFYNLSDAVRTIIFNTKNRLGRNAGILIAWIALSMITIPLFTLLMRRQILLDAHDRNDLVLI
ncbi:Domain of unknown function DUF3533 [Phaffia rhodozyma]|uniref:DUF3533 domain-containing protein n=1 Tax=Phaffia rhodozyma TaxID=264483 RepID=A0A0F7SLD2_PHARH|nr:Domain of unknown function DUF3533 [Phaffia rhodozyma]